MFNVPGDESNYAAFTARAGSSDNLQQGDIAIFDSVITNSGNHYSADTSSFMCPFDGIFSFSVSFYAGSNGNLLLELMQEEYVIRGYADEDSSLDYHYTHGMISVVIECYIGQRVWIRCGDDSDFIYGDSIRQSHFTGFALNRFS